MNKSYYLKDKAYFDSCWYRLIIFRKSVSIALLHRNSTQEYCRVEFPGKLCNKSANKRDILKIINLY